MDKYAGSFSALFICVDFRLFKFERSNFFFIRQGGLPTFKCCRMHSDTLL